VVQAGRVSLQRREDMIRWAEPRICAFDIETTKLPLQFPNAEYDQVRLQLSVPPHSNDYMAHTCLEMP
jgi:DNA polymerase elongation subunit (family B)